MRPAAALAAFIDAQRGHLFPWVPVCVGLGIGAYFALPKEPPMAVWAALGGLLVLGAALLQRRAARHPLALAVLLAVAGLCLAGARAHLVAAPKLAFRYYGPVEGRIVRIDRSASDAVRLTLDRVVLSDTVPARTPARVRVSLHGEQRFIVPRPGLTVILTGHLSPPAGPVEPGGFDFQRLAWFLRLGAVGYTRSPVLALGPPGRALPVERLRMRISSAVRAKMDGEAGAFAAAITTGDRSDMGRATLEALRDANLAHLLAISGLHMGLLTGFVFSALRLGLAAVPYLALHAPTKSWAAAGALAAGAVYLALSGGNVATQRAFVMMAVVLCAVMLGRRALTLRAVAVAALIVLALRPESLTGPGFQMSFAATTALVAVFGALRDGSWQRLPRWLRPPLAVALSSAVAGAATAPFAAAHFNQIAQYGLLANLLTVPLMGAVVIPAAVLAACLWPFGHSWIGLSLMEPPVAWILAVAQLVAERPSALIHVPAPGPHVLPLLSLGLLWLALWQGRMRIAGALPALAALLLWAQTERPDLLIASDGRLAGLMTPEGRALSKAKGGSFVASIWLENDGDPADQKTAAARPGFSGDRSALAFDISGNPAVLLGGRGAAGRAERHCNEAVLVILPAESKASGDCRIVDRTVLTERGSLAIHAADGLLQMTGALDRAGTRLWTGNPDQ